MDTCSLLIGSKMPCCGTYMVSQNVLPVCDIPTPIEDDFAPATDMNQTDTPVIQPVPPAGAAADPYVTRSGRTVVRPARFRENHS